MRMRLLAPGLAVLLLAACGKSDDTKKAEQAVPEQRQPVAPAAQRAKAALKDAGTSAAEAAAKLRDAGKAAAEAVQEQAPALQQKLGQAADTVENTAENAAQRLQNAGDALLADPDGPPMDEEDDGGDSDAPIPAGTAGTPNPDQTGSINRTGPAAPSQ